MSGNTFGKIFKITTFGESHGPALGGIIDGVPAGIKIDQTKIQTALDRRKPGQSAGGQANASVTARKESDKIEILSGVFEEKSEGTSIGFIIRNESQHSKDYSNLANTFRPRQVLEHFCPQIKITAYTQRAAGISIQKIDFSQIEQNALRAPDNDAATKMNEKIEELRKNGDSAGGILACSVTGLPAGLGECVFDKLDALLAHAILSIGAVKGIEFGAGFEAADLTGSKNNDIMRVNTDGSKVEFLTNNAGGILGGISNGNEIFFRVAVKPVPSIFKEQQTVSVDENGKFHNENLKIEGRHDVCLCPRIVPVIEAMTVVTLCDLFLQNKAGRI